MLSNYASYHMCGEHFIKDILVIFSGKHVSDWTTLGDKEPWGTWVHLTGKKILLGIYEHLQLQRNSCVWHHKSGGSGVWRDGRATLSCVAAAVVAMFVLCWWGLFLLAVVNAVPFRCCCCYCTCYYFPFFPHIPFDFTSMAWIIK